MVHSILLRELLFPFSVWQAVWCIESADEKLLTDSGNVFNLIQTLFLKAACSFTLITLKVGVTFCLGHWPWFCEESEYILNKWGFVWFAKYASKNHLGGFAECGSVGLCSVSPSHHGELSFWYWSKLLRNFGGILLRIYFQLTLH